MKTKGLTQQRASMLLGAGLFVVAIIFASSSFTFRAYFRSSDARKQSFLTISAVQELLSKVTDAETGQRGYLLTGKEEYLDTFKKALLDAPDLVTDLRRLRAQGGRQPELQDQLEEEIAVKLAELERTINLRRAEGYAAAVKVVQTDAGKKAMDQIRKICAAMMTEETVRVNASDAGMVQETERARVILVVGTALTFALIVGAGLITNFAMRERQLAEVKLVESVKQLTMSNRDLEQFAYVASHDLQEPLRMVSNYCRLLGRRYKGRLDSDADDFIGFAVDGAQRMQKLIDDLLAYSRVGAKRGKPVRAPVEKAFQEALKNLDASIQESSAKVTHDAMPELVADPNQITQLFQNLIGNAIKFKGAGPPHIHVSVENKGTEWLFGVHDDGIGIAPEYYDQIFIIFQRLNSKQEYPGTGIGLAICKKIVDTHGGKIRVDSKVGAGATFYFTFPRN